MLANFLWHNIVYNALRLINIPQLHQAYLVPGWVTVYRQTGHLDFLVLVLINGHGECSTVVASLSRSVAEAGLIWSKGRQPPDAHAIG